MGFTVQWSKLIVYNDSNVKNNVNDSEKGGIYRLSHEVKDGKPTIFYVGKGKPLRGRLLDHFSEDEDNDCITKKINNKKCYFKFVYVSGPKSRGCAERYMYDEIKPECNKVKPDLEPCEINLN